MFICSAHRVQQVELLTGGQMTEKKREGVDLVGASIRNDAKKFRLNLTAKIETVNLKLT